MIVWPLIPVPPVAPLQEIERNHFIIWSVFDVAPGCGQKAGS